MTETEIEFEFEDKDRLVPLRVLAGDGLRYVLVPTALFSLAGVGWGADGANSYAWWPLLAWNLYALLEGLGRCYEIARADWILKTTVRQEQLTGRVLRVRIHASGFRPIKRITVQLLSAGRVMDRRGLPASGRRFSVAALLSLPVIRVNRCGGPRRCHVRLIVAVDGCPDFVHDLPEFDAVAAADRFGRLGATRAEP